MEYKLVGLAGPAGSGKSLIAEKLWSHYDFFDTAFADRLKDVASTMFGWDRLALENRDYKEGMCPVWGIARREGLQLLGTEAVQGTFGMGFWVRAWRQIYDEVKGGQHVVVSDVRFEREAEEVRALGGVIVHVIRPQAPGHNGVRGHSSEKGVEVAPSDLVLDNSGDEDQLDQALVKLMIELGVIHG